MSNRLPREEQEQDSDDDILHGYVTREQLASQLKRSLRTIDRMHAARKGPPRTKIGTLIVYRIQAVREWLSKHESKPLSK